MNIVSILKDEIRLNSCMTELAFGKTNYNDIVSQVGVLAECTSYSEGKYKFNFSSWNFSDIKSFDDEQSKERLVFYCGKNLLSKNATTFQTLLEQAGKDSATKEDKDKMYEAGFVICSILTQIATEESSIPLNGSEGIIIDLNQEKTKVLFLPEKLYQYSVGGLKPIDYAALQGCWLNQTLNGLPAICFARAVVAYKTLTGRFPYTSSDPVEYNADIMDHNFLPIDLCINGINPELAKEINRGLKLNSNVVLIPGKKQKGKSSEDLTPTPTFPLVLLNNFKTTPLESKISNEDFAEKATSYLEKKQKLVKAKRTIRRNIPAIIVTTIASAVVALICNSMYKNIQESYTSKGLTSVQTIQGFYQGVNEKDTLIVEDFSHGKQMSRFVDSISQIFVINKQRMAYTKGDQGFQTMAHWLFWATTPEKAASSGVYSITNLTVDGKPKDLFINLPRKKDKPAPITVENDINIENGSKSVHKVEYYFIFTEDEKNTIKVNYIEEIVTLDFKKDRWLITKLDRTETPLNLDSQAFKNDYLELLNKYNGEIINAAEKLSLRYPFVPHKTALIREQEKLVEIYNDPFGFAKPQ